MNNRTKPNLPLLLKVREAIRQTRKTRLGPRWDQGVWRSFNSDVKPKAEDHRCQTALCFAGWTVELDNQTRWLYSAKDLATLEAKGNYVPEELVIVPKRHLSAFRAAGFSSYEEKHALTGRMYYITGAADWAQYRLGLDTSQRLDLFAGGNTLREINSVINRLMKEHSNS